MRKIYGLILLFSAIFIIAAYSVKAEDGNYKDGVYEGEFAFIKVRVTVEECKISDIEILQHGGGGEKYENMVKDMVPAIIESQSTEVDAISGATVSSGHLKKAVENALASQNKPDEGKSEDK